MKFGKSRAPTLLLYVAPVISSVNDGYSIVDVNKATTMKKN